MVLAATPMKDTIALVTGASRGLGYATALHLAKEGAQVLGLARTLGGLEELDDAAAAAGGTRPTLLPLDVGDAEGLSRMGAAIHERYGRLDLWVHCVAHAPPLAPANHVTEKDFEKVWATNVRPLPKLMRVLDPLLAASDGAVAAFMEDDRLGQPFWGAYAAGKAAEIALARAWGAEVERRGTRVLLHAPPAMPTALRARFYPGEGRDGLTPCAEAASSLVDALLSCRAASGR